MKKFFEEFKAFAMRGNVLDMAVGVVIGGAFGKITTSLVNDIIMPLVSILTGGVDFSAWKWVLKEGVMEGSEVVDPEIAVNFGNLISVILDFIIIAFAVFCMVKAINKMHDKLSKPEPEAEEEPEDEPEPTKEELLLAEMGHRTLCLDCDVGLRNLDRALGMSDSALMDFTDVILSRATLEQAAVRHPRCDRLYLLTAPVGLHEDIRMSEMKRLLDEVRSRFDYCLIDSGAGLGDAFRLATCAADRAVVVATTDPTSLRDAQRTVMELRDYPNGRLHLVVNRVRRKLLKALSSNIDDAIDAAGLPLLGVIPEDEGIPIALGRSALTVFSRESSAEIACRNIARRLTGERVPLMKLPRR